VKGRPATSINTDLTNDKRIAATAVAVRPADASTALPEPRTLALALLALSATAVTRNGQPA
jgi:hypothetical protein